MISESQLKKRIEELKRKLTIYEELLNTKDEYQIVEQSIKEGKKSVVYDEATPKRKYKKSGKYTAEKKEKKIRQRGPRRKYPFSNNREELLKVLKIYYFGTHEDQINYAGSEEIWKDMKDSFSGVKKKFSIKPQEVGLKRFPIGAEFKKGVPENFLLNSDSPEVTSEEVEYY